MRTVVDAVEPLVPAPKRPPLGLDGKAAPCDRAEVLYVASYLRMRVVIGLFGMLLPLLLWAEEGLLSDEVDPFRDFAGSLRGSMSASYHSPSRDVFVASLCVMGLFLVVYRVSQRPWENRLTNTAGGLALVVALVPTDIPDGPVNSVCPPVRLPADAYPECSVLTALQDKVPFTETLHLGAALLFFLCMALLSFMFAAQEGKRDARRNRKTGAMLDDDALREANAKWRKRHALCGFAVLAAVAWFLLKLLPDDNWWDAHSVLFAEWQGVWAFALSWLMKGFERDYLAAARTATDAPSGPDPSASSRQHARP